MLVERGKDEAPVVINSHTITMECEIIISKSDVFTDTDACKPPTLATCEPGYEPDFDEFTETLDEMKV